MNPRLSITLAALLFVPGIAFPADAPAPTPSSQEAKHFEKQIRITAKLDYLVSLPPEYGIGRKRWPLVLFLHGAGESGTDLNKVKIHGPPKIVEAKGPYPFILISPQCPGRSWNTDVVNALLDDVIKKYHADKDRVYLTGLSMGGYGTWALAAAHPEKFAAIAPICGSGNTNDAPKLANLPIWMFHGAKDTAVPIKRSEEMVAALKAAGGEPEFTVYPDAGHDAWTATYDNPEFYRWLLEQKRSKR